MLSSRLEAVFDEFLHKVKEEFHLAKKVDDVDQKKLNKNSVAPNYGCKAEKWDRLDDRPSFIFKKRNLMPGWYSPTRNFSTEFKAKYPKRYSKLEKSVKPCLEERVEHISGRRKDDFRGFRDSRKMTSPATNIEPNLKMCLCKHHKNDAEHVYDVPNRTKFSRNFRTEGMGMTHANKPRHQTRKISPLSTFTITSGSLTRSSN